MRKIFSLICIVIFFACNDDLKLNKTIDSVKQDTIIQPKPVAAEIINIPQFDAAKAYQYVEKQISFGPRVPNTENHRKCGEYLSKFFKDLGLSVVDQRAMLNAFDGTILNARNIIAQYQPKKKYRILLMAHWDTRPFADQDTKDRTKPILGANDGASGVAVLMALAENIVKDTLNIGIDIVLFDAEDYGQPDETMIAPKPDTYCLGSQYWSKNLHILNYNAEFGILLDMVGAKNAKFTKEGISNQYAPHVVSKVWSIAQRAGYSNYFIEMTTPAITDDHYYVNRIAKIPSIDIIHYDENTRSRFGEYWHTHRDNLDIIDKNTLKAVGQVLLEVIYRENQLVQ
jgi:hypothetical protein